MSDIACQTTGKFVKQLVQADIKENVNAPHYRSFMREPTGDRRIALPKGAKRFHVKTSFYSFLADGYPHYRDVMMEAMASQITAVSIVYSTVCSGTDRRKLLAFVRGIPHTKGQ